MAAEGPKVASGTTDDDLEVLSHTSAPSRDVEEDAVENQLTLSLKASNLVSSERSELLTPPAVQSPSRSTGSVRTYGSINRQEYGMDELVSWYAAASNSGSEARRQKERRPRASNTSDDEDFSIVSEDMLPLEESTEASLLGTFVDVPVTEALELCTKSVLKPFNVFLKTVGWRKFRSPSEDLHEHCCRKVLNVVYLIFIITLIVVVSVVQLLVCLRRDAVDSMKYNNSTCNQNTTICTECLKHIVTSFLIPDFLLFGAYMYALYIFRFSEPEYLQMLTQTVFLGQSCTASLPRQKKLIRVLRILLALGVSWLIFSLFSSVYRITAREASKTRVPPIWSSLPDEGRYALEAFCVLGFAIFDMVYLSIVISYSFQCQLLIYYVQSIKDRVLAYDWPGLGLEQSPPTSSIDAILEKAMKEMDQLKIFILHLNHHISWAVSLIMFIFVISIMDTFVTLLGLSNKDNPPLPLFFIGVFNLIQWVSVLVLPLVQAARLNASCNSLKTLGHTVRSRPLNYTGMSFLHLDSFLSYTAMQRLSVKLLLVRVTPGIVGGIIFVIACVLVYLLQNDVFYWAEYL